MIDGYQTQFIYFECVNCSLRTFTDSKFYEKHGPYCVDCVGNLWGTKEEHININQESQNTLQNSVLGQ